MRISPVYTPQNLVINPPHITNHPMLEVINTHMQEFEANKIGDKYIFNKTMQEEKLQNGFMTALYASALGICGYCIYKAYKTLKDNWHKIK